LAFFALGSSLEISEAFLFEAAAAFFGGMMRDPVGFGLFV
jgi:hypothetical protein